MTAACALATAALLTLPGSPALSPVAASRPTIQTVKSDTQHSCSSADFAMECVLPSQPLPGPVADLVRRGFTAKAARFTGLYGVDFAWGGPRSCSAMHALGARFAIGYLSPDYSKNLGSTAAALRACGIPSVVGWESTATRALGGFTAGWDDALAARAQAAAVGNTNRPIWFAIDFDANGPELLSYFQGAHAVLGSRTGAYGGYRPLLYLHGQGVVGSHNFQSYAWSGGLWLPASIAPLEQYLNGNTYDNDRAIEADYGQFPYAVSHPKPDPYAIFSRIRFEFTVGQACWNILPCVARASEYNTVKTWDRAHCRNPVHRAVCKSSHYHLALLRDRVWFVAHHRVSHGRWVALRRPRWGVDHLGGRYQGLSHRLGQQ